MVYYFLQAGGTPACRATIFQWDGSGICVGTRNQADNPGASLVAKQGYAGQTLCPYNPAGLYPAFHKRMNNEIIFPPMAQILIHTTPGASLPKDDLCPIVLPDCVRDPVTE